MISISDAKVRSGILSDAFARGLLKKNRSTGSGCFRSGRYFCATLLRMTNMLYVFSRYFSMYFQLIRSSCKRGQGIGESEKIIAGFWADDWRWLDKVLEAHTVFFTVFSRFIKCFMKQKFRSFWISNEATDCQLVQSKSRSVVNCGWTSGFSQRRTAQC